MWGFGRSVNAKQCNGIIIAGDHNHNISIHYGPTEARLSIPFKPNSLTDSIDSLLIWQSQLTPLIGRDETVDELMQWAKTGPRISFKLIHGAGGVGKTRLAFEVASTLREQQWEAGQLASLGSGSAFRLGTNGTLLVIDYPEQQPERVQRLLQAIKEAEEPAAPLRILLLSRRSQLLDQLGESLRFLATKPLLLTALDTRQTAWSLFASAWPRLCEQRKKGNTRLPIEQDVFNGWLAQHESHAQPLYILAFAINLMEQPQATTLSGGEIIQRLVRREVVRLEKEGEAKNLHKLALPLLKGLAAISGGITAQQLKALANHDALTALLPDYERLRDCTIWQEKKESAGQVVELQPDLLAAALLSQLLRRDDEQPGEWLYAALDISSEIESATSRLGRLMHDATEVLGLSWPQETLIEAVKSDLHRCRRLDEGLSRNYLERPLLPLALGVRQALAEVTEAPVEQARLLNNLSVDLADSGDRAGGLAAIWRSVDIYEQLSADNAAAYAPDLARSLNTLSVRLADSGDRAGGLAAIRRSVDIYEQLSADNAAAYGPDLASSLHTLSNSLADSGDRAGGLSAIRRSVDIYEQLSADNAAAYGPGLAMGLNNLSVRLAYSGDRAGGLSAIWRSVDIYEQLSADNAAAHGPDLAMSLHNLSVCLADSGDRAGGLAVSQRSVDIYEQLSVDNVAAYGPGLASSLNTLSSYLADSGDRAGGLSAIRRSVDIYEQLSADNAAAYAPDLARSLNTLSSCLADSGDRAGGLAAIRRSVDIYEQLSADNAAAYAPDLARSLNTLSSCLADSGDRAGGLSAIRRSVDIYEQLSADNAAAYAPDLASSLNTLSSCLAGSGDRAGGLSAIRRSVDIYEQLSADNAAAYAPDLARSLNTLSSCLADRGDRAGGLSAIRRSVDIYEQLSADNVAAYGPDLANSLNTLSNHLAYRSGRAGELRSVDIYERLSASRRSVEIYEQLSADNFAAYGPGLARTLNNLSNHLADSGDHGGGLAAIRRSVDIYEQLSADNVAAYGSGLAVSLNTLSTFYANDDNYSDAISMVRRAIELIRSEAIDGTTYGDWLEDMKNNLARYQASE